MSKFEDSKITENLESLQIGEQFKLLDPARLPEQPFSPNRRAINLMGLAGGLAVGMALIALLEYRDASFKTHDDVARVLALPVLAVVPLMQVTGEEDGVSPSAAPGHWHGQHGDGVPRARRVDAGEVTIMYESFFDLQNGRSISRRTRGSWCSRRLSARR